MGESFGMQLDDDSLLALYHVYDSEGSGYLAYEEIVKQILDKDYYCMYSPGGVNNTQVGIEKDQCGKLCWLQAAYSKQKHSTVGTCS